MRNKRWRRRAAACGLCVLALAAAAVPALGKGEKKRAKAPAYAVLAGSVFQESGFLLRGARVVVKDLGHPKERKQANTDVQGEFAVRLPAGKGRYEVEVSAEGFLPEKKTVEVAGDERVDLTFRLSPAAKQQ